MIHVCYSLILPWMFKLLSWGSASPFAWGVQCCGHTHSEEAHSRHPERLAVLRPARYRQHTILPPKTARCQSKSWPQLHSMCRNIKRWLVGLISWLKYSPFLLLTPLGMWLCGATNNSTSLTGETWVRLIHVMSREAFGFWFRLLVPKY